jgi:uncharacterized protein
MKNMRKSLFKHPSLILAPCDFGHGIFTKSFIAPDTTLEECPYLRIEAEACSGILDDYAFNLESAEENGDADYYSLVLGWGSLFNHSYDHNTEYWHDMSRDLIVFHTIKAVAAGEQLFVNYGKEWWDSREMTPEWQKKGV